MSSVIQNLLSLVHRRDGVHPVAMLGLDNGGKTTLVYLLKLGQIIQTIPSMGFNVEVVDAPVSGRKSFKMLLWDLGIGCGRMFYARLVRNYMKNIDAVIWVVDASDEGRLEESVEALEEIILPGDPEEVDKSIPLLILANKSDLPKAMSLDRIHMAFSKFGSGRLLGVSKTAITPDTLADTGLPEAFGWLQLVWHISRPNREKGITSATKADENAAMTKVNHQMSDLRTQQNKLVEKLESWLTRIENDVDSEEFLEKFYSFSLPAWDHYTHIRIAYVLLKKFGRKEGKDKIFNGLETYITTSPQTKGRSFHVTMTYFWIQIVHFGIRNMPDIPQSSASLLPSGPLPEVITITHQDFPRFLLINPHVADGNLWSEYYTKDVLMSQKAKNEMVLPDKKPLPSLVIRDTIKSLGKDVK
ncbi:ADP-ribosylation factor family-domain-containing protein [Gymnopilus junonius]|uniref:ADP-ribosylation factor family-domain-containing protein n=1 Tax=Gymnopilus junonius TaxID=109634 RepID=A0A9P5TSL8_GYMJU|nr:ADP-ribosylation factor family-domain-containing protein [Gymnopilus junonius]